MIKFHQTRGAFNSDIFRYLPAALDFAGMNYNHISNPSWMFNSPVIFYLTSLLFKLGHVTINSIFLVTGLFGIIGIFGMYTFLKIRFSHLLSFIGTLLYSSSSLTLFYFANGMLDTSAVAMFLWTMVFLVAAVDKNYKYYPILAVCFLISIFIRFTNIYTISLIALYVLKNHNLISLVESIFINQNEFKHRIHIFFTCAEFKYIFLSVVLGIIIIAYVFHVLLSYGSVIGYFGMANASLSHFHSSDDYNFVPDRWFYFKNLLSLLYTDSITSVGMIEKFNNPSLLSYLIVIIFLCGLVIKIINLIKNLDFFKQFYEDNNYNHSNKILLAIIVVLTIISLLVLNYNYIISLLCLWLVFAILISIFKNIPIIKNYSALSIVLIALFSFYILIFSLMDLKCVRYILIIFVAITYFVILSLEIIQNFIKYGWDDKPLLLNLVNGGNMKCIIESKNNFRNTVSKVLLLILIILFLFTAFNFINTVEIDEIGVSIDSVSNYLIDYDSDYQSKRIGVKSGEMFYEWYFQKKVDVIDFNQSYESNYTYIITYPELDDSNYHELYHYGGTFLYEHN
jgi:hypothetical protein